MAWPEKIKMNSLPFWTMHGWNKVLSKTSRYSDGCPVYELQSYNLWGLIPIVGISIFREDGIWRLMRIDNYNLPNTRCIFKYGGKPQNDPFGSWSMGGWVNAV